MTSWGVLPNNKFTGANHYVMQCRSLAGCHGLFTPIFEFDPVSGRILRSFFLTLLTLPSHLRMLLIWTWTQTGNFQWTQTMYDTRYSNFNGFFFVIFSIYLHRFRRDDAILGQGMRSGKHSCWLIKIERGIHTMDPVMTTELLERWPRCSEEYVSTYNCVRSW